MEFRPESVRGDDVHMVPFVVHVVIVGDDGPDDDFQHCALLSIHRSIHPLRNEFNDQI